MKANQSGEPYEKDLSAPIRKFEVLENGDVIMKETQTTTLKFKAPDFNSFKVNHEKELERIEENLSEKTRKTLEDGKKELIGYIDQLKPFLEDSEKKTKANYEKIMMDGSVKAVKEYFNKPTKDRNPAYIGAILENLKKEDKIKELLSRLTPEESKIVVQVKKDLLLNKRRKER